MRSPRARLHRLAVIVAASAMLGCAPGEDLSDDPLRSLVDDSVGPTFEPPTSDVTTAAPPSVTPPLGGPSTSDTDRSSHGTSVASATVGGSVSELPEPTSGPNRACRYEDEPSTGSLQLCHEGDRVRSLQQVLQNLGYDIGPTGIDGEFGPATELAVRRFQCRYGLAVDGIAGPATLATLDLVSSDPSVVTTVTRGCGG